MLCQFVQSVFDRWPIFDELTSMFDENMGDSDSGYIYSNSLYFPYLATVITELTVNNLLFAGLGVFGVLIFLMDIRMALFITLTIACIDVGMCYMYTYIKLYIVVNCLG